VFANTAGSTTTKAATVSATPVKPRITKHPRSATVKAGKKVKLAVTVTGTPAPKLQWYVKKAGSSKWTAVRGATARTLVVKANKASYRVVAKNKAGTVTSHTAKVNVKR